ncbi:tRNA pseudouridine synthase Pus10 [Candidatus Lokiarchaeum ossiferum]
MPDTPENFEEEEIKEEKEEIKIINMEPSLYQQTVSILRYHNLCFECFGRQFSFLGTATNNTDRAKAILLGLTMECHQLLIKNLVLEKYTLFDQNPLEILHLIANRTGLIQAKKMLEKWYRAHPDEVQDHLTINSIRSPCDLCTDLLTDTTLQTLVQKIQILIRKYDYNNFLVGTYVNPAQGDKEDEFRSKFGVTNGESFKANLNRLLGVRLQKTLQKPTKFEKPDLTIMVNLRESNIPKIEITSSPLYLRARYLKFVRDLPQTHWHCHFCRGRGTHKFTGEICPECHGSGDMFPSSVEDLIAETLLPATGGEKAILHGAGREDLDARCLGAGREFIMEIKEPRSRHLNYLELTQTINKQHGKSIHVTNFTVASKKDVIKFKKNSEFNKKKYHALVELAQPISLEEANVKFAMVSEQLCEKKIKQRTPLRVVHRRPDKTRTKIIYSIECKYVDPLHIYLKVLAQGGTYIKELISGDNFRTSPSIATIFNIPMVCAELDVVQIEELQV